jgi:ribosomal protein L29
MPTIKFKDLKKMNDGEIKKKLKELKLELVMSKVNSSKSKVSKTKEIKKIIAKILTLNPNQNKELKTK